MTNSKYDEFILYEYRQCFESMEHYDSLSWTIATVTLAIVGSIIAFLIKYSVESRPFNSLILKIFGTGPVAVWFNIYERNRFCKEAANERARDIERDFAKRDRLGINFARAALTKKVVLKNKDTSGNKIGNKGEKTI